MDCFTAPGSEEPAVDPENGAKTEENPHRYQTQVADHSSEQPPPAKKQRLSGAQKTKLARQQDAETRKANRGINTARRFSTVHDPVSLCWRVASGDQCETGADCRFSHDISSYLNTKPCDLYWASSFTFTAEAPFVAPHEPVPSHLHPSLDSSTTCPNGVHCSLGYKCRFLGGHVGQPSSHDGDLPFYIVKESLPDQERERNRVGFAKLKLLRSKKYPTPKAEIFMRELDSPRQADVSRASSNLAETQAGNDSGLASHPVSSPDDPESRILLREKKRLHWEGLTHLAPLATLGNLPFRRLCVELGADVTCSEMTLATSLLSGSREDWSLLRYHPSERHFGMQVAGGKPALLTRVSEIIANEIGSNGLEYANVNCGCPIDLVFQSGAGSALLDTPGKLGKILAGMNHVLGDVPLTIKVRTGVKDGKNTAHKLLPNLAPWGVSAFAIHGRTRQQRYTRAADWDYIKECADTLRAANADAGTKIPIIGGGDVFSAQAYYETLDKYGVDAVMIGRGALIKPWFFTEIQERREWDISATERLELLSKFATYGLNHWGSDTQGVNITRRFFCDALSFQHRYVPVGLLETLPPVINRDRPRILQGRSELESLLASPQSTDWVKLSELFLGPSPEGWTFVPKHKSNAVEETNNG